MRLSDSKPIGIHEHVSIFFVNLLTKFWEKVLQYTNVFNYFTVYTYSSPSTTSESAVLVFVALTVMNTFMLESMIILSSVDPRPR